MKFLPTIDPEGQAFLQGMVIGMGIGVGIAIAIGKFNTCSDPTLNSVQRGV